MSDAVLSHLQAAGLTLPEPSRPAANYVPFTRAEPLLFIAGQTPVLRGEPQYLGVVGEDVSIDQAQAAARVCALNILAQVHAALNENLDRTRCLRLGGFVRCRADFTQQPLVMNGASDLILLALGENGRHARTAFGTNALPRGMPVEVEAVFAVG
jgi:enamine deaminase RidA (YjgF/YER057c/UK114 family)